MHTQVSFKRCVACRIWRRFGICFGLNIHQSTLLSSLVLDACLLDSLTVIDPLSSKVLECELFNYLRITTDLTVSLIVRLDYGSLEKKKSRTGNWFSLIPTSYRCARHRVQRRCVCRKPVENLWKNGSFWSRCSFVTHSIDRKPRDWGLARSAYSIKYGTSCLGHPSGDVPCASEDMACGYWFSKWRTTKSIWVR